MLCKALRRFVRDVEEGRMSEEKCNELIKKHIDSYHDGQGFCHLYNVQTAFPSGADVTTLNELLKRSIEQLKREIEELKK